MKLLAKETKIFKRTGNAPPKNKTSNDAPASSGELLFAEHSPGRKQKVVTGGEKKKVAWTNMLMPPGGAAQYSIKGKTAMEFFHYCMMNNGGNLPPLQRTSVPRAKLTLEYFKGFATAEELEALRDSSVEPSKQKRILKNLNRLIATFLENKFKDSGKKRRAFRIKSTHKLVQYRNLGVGAIDQRLSELRKERNVSKLVFGKDQFVEWRKYGSHGNPVPRKRKAGEILVGAPKKK